MKQNHITEKPRGYLKILALGSILGASTAQAQNIINVGGVDTIASDTLTTTKVPIAGDNWKASGGDGNTFSSLISPPATVANNGAVTLTFTHRYNFESTFDGGVIFVSVNGGAFTKVPLTSFTSNGYNDVAVASVWAADEEMFGAQSTDWGVPTLITSVADLGVLNATDTVAVEFRGGWDGNTFPASPNWEIGTVQISDSGGPLLNVNFPADGKSGFTATTTGTGASPWNYLQATNRFEIDADAAFPAEADRYAPVTVGSAIDLNGANIQVALLSGTLVPNTVFTLFDLDGGTTLTGSIGSLSLPTGTWNTANLATNGTITFVAPVTPGSQLGILNLAANGGINPNTNAPWQVGDKYRLAFYTAGKSEADITDATFYNDFVTTQAKLNSPLAGTSWRALMSTESTNIKNNTGTSNVTGGAGVGGAGEPVYVVNGSTCIARNNADIWDTWSNPFASNAIIRLAAGSTNNNSAGTPVVASQSVHYSPFIDQFGLGDSATVHGVEVWTGSNSNGTNLAGQEVGHVPNTNWGSSNANNTTRVWNRGNANSGLRSFYAISIPLTVVDLNEMVLPTLTSFVDSQAGADYFLGAAPIVYTVTFSEAIDASTLTPADFGNGGTAGITVDIIRGTLDGAVFAVTVTPTSAGTLQLQVNASAVIEDPVGNELDTSLAILDDTTITVINDETPPTLTSIVDDVSGGPVVATKFSTPTYTVTFNELIQPASLTTADFENGSTAPVTIDSVSPTGDPAVFLVTVTTSAPGNLVLRIKQDAVVLDVAGNELDTTSALPDNTTITVNPVPELAGQLGVLDVVNANGGINPATGLAWAAGDTYRLIFLTSQTTNATSTDIATYNTFVQGVASASSTYPDLGNGTWKILASTETVAARDNTGTNPGSGTGVGIFLTNGRTIIASNNADLWDGFLTNTVSLNENASLLVENRVFTGSNFNGTSVGVSGGDKPLGVLDGDGVRTGQSDSLQFWFVQWKENANNLNSVYALSEPLTVVSTAVGNTFTTWLTGFTLTDTTFGGDDDRDNLANGIEAFFGTDPSVSNAGLAVVGKSGNTVTFTHPNPDAIDVVTDVTGSYEWSADLVTWYQDDGVEGPGATTVTTVATPDSPTPNTTTVFASIGGTVPEKLFLRVVATQP